MSFTPKIGKRYRVVFTPIYRHLTIEGVDWALGDLYFDETGANAYAFRHTNANFYNMTSAGVKTTASVNVAGVTTHWNGFWNFRARKPGGGQAVNQVDPCSLVFPKGRWRMPTEANFGSISTLPVDAPNPTKLMLSNSNPVRYILVRLNANSGQPYEQYQQVTFRQLGYRNGNNNFARNEVSYGGSGYAALYYWTSTVVGPNFRYYKINTNPVSGNSNYVEAYYNSTTGTNGYSVRCVRDASFSFLNVIQNT